jgi:hypothetical protein
LLSVVSIAAEVVCDDLSDLPGLGIVCQLLAHLRRRKIIGQAKEVHWHFAVPHSEKPFMQKCHEMGKVPIDAMRTSDLHDHRGAASVLQRGRQNVAGVGFGFEELLD